MKVISKRISRNEFISRKNGVIPWLLNEWSVPCGYGDYSFDTYSSAVQKANELGLSSSLLEYRGKFTYNKDYNNYGFIVSDIILPQDIASSITDYTDFYVNIPDGNGGYYDLNDHFSCVRYNGRKIISGGTFIDASGNTLCTCFSGDCDEEKLRMAVDLTGGTEVKILTYYTLNKWYTFFKEYYEKIKPFNRAIDYYNDRYENKNDENKKKFTDLDALFDSRGGSTMYKWIIRYCMPHDDDRTPDDGIKNYATNSASYVVPILLTNSIDDLGEMAIFSSKWKDGVNYQKTEGSTLGTVVDRPYYEDGTEEKNIITDNETYSIQNGIGYTQNKFNENVFVPSDWVNYTDWSIDNNRRNFASYDVSNNVTTYAYSPVNGRVIYNQSIESETIPYLKKDFITVDGEFIQVIEGECVTPKYPSTYVTQKHNQKIPVMTDGAVKYAELNGKRFYAVNEGNDIWKIYFLKKYDCYDSGSMVFKESYVLYNGSLFLKSGNTITIEYDSGDTKTYNVLNGYFTYNGIMYFVSGNSVIISDDEKKAMGWNAISVNTSAGTITIDHKLDTKTANIITGYTDSKLELLRRKKVNTDELGNDLPGYIDFPLDRNGTNYNTAYDGCELDLLYKVGQFSDIEYQKKVGNANYFNGNYLESIVFYHVDENGNKIESSITSVNINDEPKSVARRYFEGGDMYRYGLTVYCDVTYYIGVTLEFDEENSRYIPSPGRHKGVKYVDTLTVNKSVGTFYMSDHSTFGFIYYELNGNTSAEYLCDFRDVSLTNMSYFEMEIMTFFDDNRGRDNIFKTDYWERNNGMIASPVFRPEYNLFSTTQQNTTDNIYIDRGISAAFERHLKLLETHNMEALENYGNGYFKISEY